MLCLMVCEAHHHSNEVSHVQVIIYGGLMPNTVLHWGLSDPQQQINKRDLHWTRLLIANCCEYVVHVIVCIVKRQLMHR